MSLLEIALIQIVAYAFMWLYNEYAALLLSGIFIPIALGVLIISLIGDRIESSKVGSKYYYLLILSIIIPLSVAGFFYYVYGGEMNILQ